MAQPLAGVLDRHEAVTQPPPRGAVAADVGETLVVVAVWRAERDLLYCLVQHQTFGLRVRDSQTVSGYVQRALDNSSFAIFHVFQGLLTYLHSSGFKDLE